MVLYLLTGHYGTASPNTTPLPRDVPPQENYLLRFGQLHSMLVHTFNDLCGVYCGIICTSIYVFK